MDTNMFMNAVEVAIFGLIGVFSVLILFYISTKIMLMMFKEK
ncbi:hypothetical protein [Peptoniphilus ovalis]|nr:hypothetical protein [Peptoniphilus ovalis]